MNRITFTLGRLFQGNLVNQITATTKCLEKRLLPTLKFFGHMRMQSEAFGRSCLLQLKNRDPSFESANHEIFVL